jgi:anaphase-promoting complex subunit 11
MIQHVHTDSSNITSRKRRNETTDIAISSDRITNENAMTQRNQPQIPETSTSSNAAATPKAKVHMNIRMKRYHGIAFWTWGANTKDDVCSICQNAFEGVCPGVKYPGEDCPVVWGKCYHAFHLQCINTWLTSTNLAAASATTSIQNKNSCPICRQEWEFGSSTPGNSTATTTTATINNDNVNATTDN